MDDVIVSKPDDVRSIGNTFILCIFDNEEITYVFNESKNLSRELISLKKKTLL